MHIFWTKKLFNIFKQNIQRKSHNKGHKLGYEQGYRNGNKNGRKEGIASGVKAIRENYNLIRKEKI